MVGMDKLTGIKRLHSAYQIALRITIKTAAPVPDGIGVDKLLVILDDHSDPPVFVSLELTILRASRNELPLNL